MFKRVRGKKPALPGRQEGGVCMCVCVINHLFYRDGVRIEVMFPDHESDSNPEVSDVLLRQSQDFTKQCNHLSTGSK